MGETQSQVPATIVPENPLIYYPRFFQSSIGGDLISANDLHSLYSVLPYDKAVTHRLIRSRPEPYQVSTTLETRSSFWRTHHIGLKEVQILHIVTLSSKADKLIVPGGVSVG